MSVAPGTKQEKNPTAGPPEESTLLRKEVTKEGKRLIESLHIGVGLRRRRTTACEIQGKW